MTTFDDRQKSFEMKFERDQDLQFKVNARRNKLLGLWAAGVMGKSGTDAEGYAKEVVLADFEKRGVAAAGRADTRGCLHVTESADLSEAIRLALQDAAKIARLRSEREAVVGELFDHADGRSGDRAAEALERVVSGVPDP